MRKILFVTVALGLLGALAVSAAAQEVTPTPNATAVPSATPEHTAPPATPEPTETETPTATFVPTMEPTETPLPAATSTPTAAITAGPTSDPYEVDSATRPQPYSGAVRRCFYPEGDVDYLLFNGKTGQTEVATYSLSGGVDTQLAVRVGDQIVAADDDSGEGLASRVTVQLAQETQLVIEVANKAVAYGAEACYSVVIIPEAVFTPTPTAIPTREIPATATPWPTYTPYPSPTPLPPPPRAVPPQPRPAAPVPAALVVQFTLRVEVFIDGDEDLALDVGEGVEAVRVAAANLRGDYRLEGVTAGGVLVLDIECPPGEPPHQALEVQVPYLQETKLVEIRPEQDGEVVVVQFPLPAPILPINLP